MQEENLQPRILNMKLLALNGDQCGEPPEVPAKAKFVTCKFCSAHLRAFGSQASQVALRPLLRLKSAPQGLRLGSRYQSW